MDVVIIVIAAINIALTTLVVLRARKSDRQPVDYSTLSTSISDAVRNELRASLSEIRQDLSNQRTETQQTAKDSQERLDNRLRELVAEQAADRQARQAAFAELSSSLNLALGELKDAFASHANQGLAAQGSLRTTVEERFDAVRVANDGKLEQIRASVEKFQLTNTQALDKIAERVQTLIDSNGDHQRQLRISLSEELDKLRTGNEAKLEKMRETVDEKLQGTLERRLGESFALVSERLEQVQQGLGEMRTLATDVGGLKRVLTNVKSRGSWGEVQLERQLEDMLSPEQFERNVAVKSNSAERVEFAVRLPGREDDAVVYLPIDSKLPHEDYERLLAAQEEGEKSALEIATKALERAILGQAKLIAEKYLSPPETTDFAIMYLPTEGLFAEAVRIPGLASKMQNEHRILITGPTTLMSLLNSLQMGFRTLAIEKRSSEVWKVLSAAKSEFFKYGQVWEKLEKQLTTAQNTVTEAGRRTRAVERKLRNVEMFADEVAAPTSIGVLDADELAEAAGLPVLEEEDAER